MGKHIEHRVSPNWADEMDQDLDEIKRTLRADVVASTENLASQAITKFLPLRTDLEEIKIVAKDARDLAQASVDENLRTCEALVSLDKTLKAHPQVAPLDADIIKLLEAELIDESKMVLKDAVKAVVKGHSLDRVLDIESNMKELGTKVQACMNMLTDQAHLGAFAPVEMVSPRHVLPFERYCLTILQDLADVPVTLRNVIVGLVQRGVKQDAAVAELQRRVQDQAAQVQQVQQARQANANANVDRVAGRVGKVEKTVDELGQMLSLYPTRDEVKATAEEEVREGAVLLAKNFAKTHTDAEAKLKEWVKQTFARRRT